MLAFLALLAAPAALYVSPAGSDAAPGTISRPFATLGKAVESARARRIKRIVVGPGEYALAETIALDQRDSGLTIEAGGGSRPLVTGALAVLPSRIRQETDSEVSRRARLLDPSAKVFVVDAGSIGLDGLVGFTPYGFPKPIVPGPTELFLDTEPLRIARWPNEGFATAASEPGQA